MLHSSTSLVGCKTQGISAMLTCEILPQNSVKIRLTGFCAQRLSDSICPRLSALLLLTLTFLKSISTTLGLQYPQGTQAGWVLTPCLLSFRPWPRISSPLLRSGSKASFERQLCQKPLLHAWETKLHSTPISYQTGKEHRK